MQTDYLREFVDLCDTLNFTRSSRRLNLSQPTLSRHIQALEADLGARLFERSADHVKITPAGRSLYDEARALIKQLDSIQASALRNSEHKVTTLKVSGSTIQPTLNRFLTRMQARSARRGLPIRFEYAYTRQISGEQPPRDTVELLDSCDTDLLVEFSSPTLDTTSGHGSLHLCREPLFALASGDSPLSPRRGLTVEDLSGRTILLCSVFQHCTTLYEDALRRCGCEPGRVRTAIVDDLLVIPELLSRLSPDEVAIFQANFVATYGFGDDLAGNICRLDLDDPRFALDFYLMWRPGDNRPEVRLAVDLAREVARDCAACPSPAADQFVAADWGA